MSGDELAAAFAAAGIDTPEKAAQLIGYAGKVLARQQLSYKLDAAMAKREQTATAANAEVEAARAALAAMDAELAQ